MTPGRLWRRLLVVVLLTCVVFFSQRGAFKRMTDQLLGARIDWHSDYAMSNHLYDLIVERHLTNVSRPCLLLNIHGGDPPDATNLDVYKRPTEACMGAASKQLRLLPRLFGLRVDRDAGTVETDAGTPDHYHPLD